MRGKEKTTFRKQWKAKVQDINRTLSSYLGLDVNLSVNPDLTNGLCVETMFKGIGKVKVTYPKIKTKTKRGSKLWAKPLTKPLTKPSERSPVKTKSTVPKTQLKRFNKKFAKKTSTTSLSKPEHEKGNSKVLMPKSRKRKVNKNRERSKYDDEEKKECANESNKEIVRLSNDKNSKDDGIWDVIWDEIKDEIRDEIRDEDCKKDEIMDEDCKKDSIRDEIMDEITNEDCKKDDIRDGIRDGVKEMIEKDEIRDEIMDEDCKTDRENTVWYPLSNRCGFDKVAPVKVSFDFSQIRTLHHAFTADDHVVVQPLSTCKDLFNLHLRRIIVHARKHRQWHIIKFILGDDGVYQILIGKSWKMSDAKTMFPRCLKLMVLKWMWIVGATHENVDETRMTSCSLWSNEQRRKEYECIDAQWDRHCKLFPASLLEQLDSIDFQRVRKRYNYGNTIIRELSDYMSKCCS